MPRITPLHWKVLECIFKYDGFVFHRQRGSHRAYVKNGIIRPIIIPTYPNVDVDIIKGLMRTAGMEREKYFKLLAKCK
jgi:predicted RNA binding protein YcfA (HicA-like mRNA interferase family)